jgi:zinc transporter ZupT
MSISTFGVVLLASSLACLVTMIGIYFMATAKSTPLDTLVSFPFISKIDRLTLGIFVAVSAGALTYVPTSHLLPAASCVEKENERYTLWEFES